VEEKAELRLDPMAMLSKVLVKMAAMSLVMVVVGALVAVAVFTVFLYLTAVAMLATGVVVRPPHLLTLEM
jgi:hypothetical protein